MTNEQDVDSKEAKAKLLLQENSFGEAADLYGEVLEIRIRQHGELAVECAPSYYNYGHCLVQCMKYEYDVLGGFVKKDSKQNIEDQADSEEEGDGSGDDSDRDINETLELANEMLEMARIIYENHQCPENALELSEVYHTIGDLYLEIDNIEPAVTEYRKCLELRKQKLSEDDRRLAEIHYSVGLAYQYQENTDKALEHFENSRKVLQCKLCGLQQAGRSDEIHEIEEVLQELEAKMDDLKQESVTPNKSSFLPPSDGFSKPQLPITTIKDLGTFGGTHHFDAPNDSDIRKRKILEHTPTSKKSKFDHSPTE